MSTLAEAPPIYVRRPAAKEPYLKPVHFIALALLALAYGPLLYTHGTILWAKPHYEFFPLVLAGSAILAWSASKRLGALQPGKYRWLVWLGAGFCLLTLAWGALIDAPLFGVTSFLVGILVFLYSFGGWTLLKAMLPAWIFLWIAVPPPRNLDISLILWLQSSTSSWSSYFLDLFGILHRMQGNVVEVPKKMLMVEQACSGINSLFAILTCSLFFVFWSKRGIIHAIFLLAAGVGWVLVGNLARVIIIAVAWDRRGIDLATGWKHEALGFAIFAVLLVLVWSTDRLLMFVFATLKGLLFWRREAMSRELQAKLERQRAKDYGSTRWPSLAGAWFMAKPALACLAAIGLFNGAMLAMGSMQGAPLTADVLVQRFGKLDKGFFPPKIGNWEQDKFEEEQRSAGDIKGDYSRTWHFRNKDLPAIFSLDYAWTDYHELQVCYNSSGWTVAKRQEHLNPIPGTDRTDHIMELDMTKPLGQTSYLLFTQFESDGLAANLPKGESIVERLTRFSFKPKKRLLVYQTQVFTQGYAPLSDAQKKECWQLFEYCRQRVAALAPNRAGGQP